MFHHRQCHLR